ncbi:Cupredoxin [Phyllosticta capitalensis]
MIVPSWSAPLLAALPLLGGANAAAAKRADCNSALTFSGATYSLGVDSAAQTPYAVINAPGSSATTVPLPVPTSSKATIVDHAETGTAAAPSSTAAANGVNNAAAGGSAAPATTTGSGANAGSGSAPASSGVVNAAASGSAAATPSVCAGNTATTRDQWCDYDINTDYYNEVPDTGVVREYWLELLDMTLAPDGIPRVVQTVNGTIPGPMIEANWGDTVVVHVTNNLNNSLNGTSIHWHGLRQSFNNQNDGVSSITQCPTPPGQSYTYTWRAEQYGSTWYHSHFALQTWEGIYGPLVVHGPATANYDEDLGFMMLSDWGHRTVDEQHDYANTQGAPVLDTGLINGMNTWTSNTTNQTVGKRFETNVVAGKTYRLRLVNTAINTMFKFMIDNHNVTVIANDLVPIKPFEADIVPIHIGQRYDIIFTANQDSTASDFWMRAIPQVACSPVKNAKDIKAILHYGNSTKTPTTTGYNYTDECTDFPMTDLVPYVPMNAQSGVTLRDAATIAKNSDGYYKWSLNSTTMVVEWDNPTLMSVYNNETNFTQSNAVIELPQANQWVILVVDSTLPLPHPMHLHGHDFMVLAQGVGTYNSSIPLEMTNPPRRDVAIMPASGYLVFAFETDNPGAWLMHCHIGWVSSNTAQTFSRTTQLTNRQHAIQGFALQILERYDEIRPLIDEDQLKGNCQNWDSFDQVHDLVQTNDSGI